VQNLQQLKFQQMLTVQLCGLNDIDAADTSYIVSVTEAGTTTYMAHDHDEISSLHSCLQSMGFSLPVMPPKFTSRKTYQQQELERILSIAVRKDPNLEIPAMKHFMT